MITRYTSCLWFLFITYVQFSGMVKARALPALTDIHNFYISSSPSRGPLRLGPGWVEKSLTTCAIMCLDAFQDCHSFMFNPDTGLCTPGAAISSHQPPPTAAEGLLYYSCDSDEGFSLQVYESTVACVGLFRSKLNYKMADEACTNKGGFLMSVKNLDKLMILTQIWDFNNTWVGCDDLLQSGEYRWREDGQLLTEETKSTVFSKNEPSDLGKGQDCVNIGAGTVKLMDMYCQMSAPYVCEILLP